ncbi:mismatch-specific DNA-glycosylase [Tumebacillus algifaecis]|nr:mismatch-specific DNA-glycosylase [Tumebacillus algifaecis]
MRELNQQPIPDSIKKGLRILFIGYNPSLTSGEIGHNYAGRGNRFWRLLHDAGLTPRLIKPAEDRDLLEIGYGFTNIVARSTRRADEITRQEYAEGRVRLRELISEHTPMVACFVGKGVYEEYNGHRSIPWGVQPESAVPGVIDFVAPSSSGLVRMKYEDILEIYRELSVLVNR